ncbi:hypothetical protein OLJ30_001737 [Salmonella enterica]|nr:hypothetical protein [Salmonella enterica]EFX2401772.1 hypothetical protein [Salmonella enterica]EGB6332741.1 hypothetical protein [Salmonella enterica]EIK5540465.1 hypothetical protein [Salmonella enterica]EJD7846786.1 hypothetical protein [Salmonella enterica]
MSKKKKTKQPLVQGKVTNQDQLRDFLMFGNKDENSLSPYKKIKNIGNEKP